jgi:hypothetical protein
LRPTLVGLDEAQCVKRFNESGRGRRIDRWRVANPDVPMVVLSGSPGEEFAAYAHLMVWGCPSLRSDRGGPIPVDTDGRPNGPEFRDLCKRLREDEAFHAAFWTRLRAWPGVVISSETYTEKPLVITHELRPTPPEMEEHWARLRGTGEAPDGWLLEGLGEQWGLARQMAGAGCYYEHVPRPPEEYRAAKKAWWKFCQTVIDMGTDARGGPYDTPGTVAEGCIRGDLPDAIHAEWLRQKPTYNPITKTTWLTTEALDYAETWGRERAPLATKKSGGSIIWTRWSAFGDELSRRTGWPYYGKEARDSRRRLVQDATDPVIICSTKSCGTGKNLQRYSRALWMNPPSNCGDAEQQIGREHRSNQMADLVECTFSYGCLEDWCAALKAEAAAQGAEDDLTAPRKIAMAQHNRTRYVEVDTSDDTRGLAWRKADKTVVVDVPDTED